MRITKKTNLHLLSRKLLAHSPSTAPSLPEFMNCLVNTQARGVILGVVLGRTS